MSTTTQVPTHVTSAAPAPTAERQPVVPLPCCHVDAFNHVVPAGAWKYKWSGARPPKDDVRVLLAQQPDMVDGGQ